MHMTIGVSSSLRPKLKVLTRKVIIDPTDEHKVAVGIVTGFRERTSFFASCIDSDVIIQNWCDCIMPIVRIFFPCYGTVMYACFKCQLKEAAVGSYRMTNFIATTAKDSIYDGRLKQT